MDVNPKQRRRHSAAFKAQVLAACTEPGASVAAVALSFGLNDNLVHQWRRGRGANVDNNSLENLIRPWAIGRRAWLFAGSALADQRAAIVMSLVQSAKLHGHDPWTYLNDVLTRLPTQLNSRIEELLPHN